MDKLTADLLSYKRDPFLNILRQALTNIPSEDALKELSPTQWIDYTTKAAKLYGFSDQSTVNHNHRLIAEMTSDEVDAAIAELDKKNQALDVEYQRLDMPKPGDTSTE